MDEYIPYPSKVLYDACNLSLYQTSKELKALKAQGYFVDDWHAVSTEYGPIVLIGCRITDKAKETEEYKKAFEDGRKIVLESYGSALKEGAW
jgi:hypothetical protein